MDTERSTRKKMSASDASLSNDEPVQSSNSGRSPLPEPPRLPPLTSRDDPHASSGSSTVDPLPPVLLPEPPLLEEPPPVPLSVPLPAPPVPLSVPLPAPPLPLSVSVPPSAGGSLPQARLTEQTSAPSQRAEKMGRFKGASSELVRTLSFFMRSPRGARTRKSETAD